MKRFFLGAAFAAVLSTGAFAGEQYVDATGFAVSGYDVVAYRQLDQAPVGQPQPSPVPGKAAYTAEHNGATFAFSSAENRALFVADPSRYAPVYDGHCAFGVSKGGKVPGNPALWRIVDDRLYLNITANVVGFWEADIPGNISLAEGNWPTIEDAPSSSRTIPDFISQAPVTD